MKPDRFLIASVVLLAIGLYLTFGYCNGTVGMSAAYPLAAATLNICVTTNGPGVLGGPALTGLGVLLLLWALIGAVVGQFRLIGAGRKRSEAATESDLRPKHPKD
jgi:hypothetical protein